MTERIFRVASGQTAGSANAGAAAVRALLQVNATDERTFAHELLERLIEVTGAKAGRIEVDRDDSRGVTTLAAIGRLDGSETVVHAAMPVMRPWSGRVMLATSGTPWTWSLTELAAERLGLVLENERLREADLRRQIWLTFLAEVSELLAQSLDIKLTLALIPRLVVPRLGQWCVVYVADEDGGLDLAAAAHMDEAVLPRLEATLAADAEAAHGGRWQEALHTMTVTALVTPLDGYTVPLIARGQWLGALAIGRHPGQRRDQDELTIGEDLARRAALAMDNARSHDERRRVAEALQRALLPATLPQVEGIGLAAEYVPATDGVDVGGDFYDVTALPDGRCLVLVGDVSGKGAQAASVTGLVREVFRVLVRDGRALTSVLSTLNETLYERRERHCTLALADVSREGDLLHVSVYLAGHDRPLLVRQDGTITTIGEWGTALGLLEEVTCPVATVTLQPGDTLVFYTDGVTDRRRGAEFYGVDRLKTAARQVAGYPADVVAARLRTAALDFSAEPQRDDMAIVVLRNES